MLLLFTNFCFFVSITLLFFSLCSCLSCGWYLCVLFFFIFLFLFVVSCWFPFLAVFTLAIQTCIVYITGFFFGAAIQRVSILIWWIVNFCVTVSNRRVFGSKENARAKEKEAKKSTQRERDTHSLHTSPVCATHKWVARERDERHIYISYIHICIHLKAQRQKQKQKQ